MPKDEIDAGEVLRKLAELKRTLPEDEYQEIERQVLPRLAANFGESNRATKKKSGWASTVGGVVGILIFWVVIIPGLLALAEKARASQTTLGNIGGILLLILVGLLFIGFWALNFLSRK